MNDERNLMEKELMWSMEILPHIDLWSLSDSSERCQLCASVSSTSCRSDRSCLLPSISHGRINAPIVQGKFIDLWSFEGVTRGRKTVIISQNQKGRKGGKQENPFRDELIFPRWAFSSSFSRLFNDRQNQRLHHTFEGVDSFPCDQRGELMEGTEGLSFFSTSPNYKTHFNWLQLFSELFWHSSKGREHQGINSVLRGVNEKRSREFLERSLATDG